MRVPLTAVFVLAACGGPPPDPTFAADTVPRLPVAEAAVGLAPGTMVVELPDGGGFLLNGTTTPQESIPARLTQYFAARDSGQRQLLVVDNPARRVDAQWIARAARTSGGQAFDAGPDTAAQRP